jgi:polyisoprenoid-binding protein YceI
VIETGSSAASDASLKQRLEGADLFNPAVRPEATFRTTDLREVSRGGDVTIYAVQGVLALAGRTHAVTLPVEISQVTDGTVARLTTSLDEGGWQTAFGRSAQGIFDDRLQLAVRLLFPAAGRR